MRLGFRRFHSSGSQRANSLIGVAGGFVKELREIVLRVDPVPFARAGQARQDRRPAATLISDEETVFPVQHQAARPKMFAALPSVRSTG